MKPTKSSLRYLWLLVPFTAPVVAVYLVRLLRWWHATLVKTLQSEGAVFGTWVLTAIFFVATAFLVGSFIED